MIAGILACALATQSDNWIGKAQYYGAKDGDSVYEIKRDDLVLDFKNGSLQSGKPPSPDLSTYTGTGLLVQGRRNVTIKNFKVRGYRYNIRIVDCDNVRLENVDASASRTIRNAQNGSPIDLFLDIRNVDVWRTYGAGIWIENSKNVTVKKTVAKGAQNGIVLVDTTHSTLIENDFSYNSGWGIALGRSSDNRILWNHADFVNRPWAGGWGGDSAAIAVADSSHRNYFVGNSLTHSGDGFFLTHRSDRFDERNRKIELFGPSNDNVVAYNDGSWSTANAFEGTFSRGNIYYKNWANDSLAAGFWLGYSDESLVLENEVDRNRNSGVAIEHGRRNVVAQNHIQGSAWAGVAFWAAGDWRGSAKPSENNDSIGNKLIQNGKVYNLENSRNPYLRDEIVQFGPGSVASRADPNVPAMLDKFRSLYQAHVEGFLKMRPSGWKFYRETALAKGTPWIQIGDWSPRDFSRDLAPWRLRDPGSIEMILQQDGVRVAAPPILQYEPTPENPRLVRICAAADPNIPGEDQPVLISLSTIDGKRKQQVKTTLRTGVWQVSWFEWPSLKYDDAAGWKALFASEPKLRQTTRLLGGDFTGRSPGEGVATHHFACVAETKFKTEGGSYVFRTISDDGIRLFVDGEEVISRWNHHGPTKDEAAINLKPGVHQIRVEYCQESGAAVLQVDWRKTG